MQQATPEWLRAANAEHLLRLALDENRRLKHAMQAVEAALIANPNADVFERGLAQILAEARGAQ